MSTSVMHHGNQDFDLQELKRFRVERVPSIASMSGEAATSQARMLYAIDEERLYIGRAGVFRPLEGGSVSWQNPVSVPANLVVSPVPSTGEARAVLTGLGGAPSVYVFNGLAWADILEDTRLVYRDASRAFSALPLVTGGPVATLSTQLITKNHYDTVQPSWYSVGNVWGTTAASVAALGTATVVGTVRAALTGAPSGTIELYVWTAGSTWKALTDQSSVLDLAATRPLSALPVVTGAPTPTLDTQLTPKGWVDSQLAGVVPVGRTVTAGTGLTGGGDLSGNITITANVGTAAGTLAAGDDARLGRSINVGTGMTGGGSLGAGNVSVGLSFGVGAGTVCAGNDARLDTIKVRRLAYSALPTPDWSIEGLTALVPDTYNQVYRCTGVDYNGTVTSSNTSRDWRAVASSYDGKILLALDAVAGTVQFSSNGGATWANKHTSQVWMDCSIAFDGSNMVVVGASQAIFTSIDGTNWVSRDIARAWSKVRLSADGLKGIAAVDGGTIYITTDSGATWTSKTPSATTWGGVAASGTGLYMVAVANGGHLFLSEDTGTTWSDDPALFGPLGNKAFESVSISEDGSIILATTSQPDSTIYTINRVNGTVTSTAPVDDYTACAMSYDARVQLAVIKSGGLLVSVNSGATWASKGSTVLVYAALATSFDGSRCFLAGQPGFLYTGLWGWELMSGLRTSSMYDRT